MGKANRKGDQPASEGITPLLAPLQALQNILYEFNNQGVIIGGIAANMLGTPRYWVEQFGDVLD
jgi:hypothetical protein